MHRVLCMYSLELVVFYWYIYMYATPCVYWYMYTTTFVLVYTYT